MYAFDPAGERLAGATRCLVFRYTQNDGAGALTVFEGKGQYRPRIVGEIWVDRESLQAGAHHDAFGAGRRREIRARRGGSGLYDERAWGVGAGVGGAPGVSERAIDGGESIPLRAVPKIRGVGRDSFQRSSGSSRESSLSTWVRVEPWHRARRVSLRRGFGSEESRSRFRIWRKAISNT